MTESIALENWQHYSTTTAKRKRADLVCFTCHAKKIKCNLQVEHPCKNCLAAGRPCHARPNKREKRRKADKSARSAHLNDPPDDISNGVDALLAANATLESFTGDTTAQCAVADGSPHHGQTSISSLPNPKPDNYQPNISPQQLFNSGPTVHNSPMDPRGTDVMTSGLAETTPTQNGDVDTGFLQVYAEENQFDAENQALVAQLEHRYCSDLRPDLEQIFTETYFEYCYPWCPVLDRRTLASDIARSPLLANALALASSHIQPPLLPHNGPEAYYKRARTIFYDDEEANETMTLKALCLFYWWAPQSPSRVHRHSSWWWTSVIIRHAQQMNIHREPSLNDPKRRRLDLGLRRRIWWTVFARERLTSLCQSKPAIIDPNDCNIPEPTLVDFPPDARSQHQGEIFIYWVRLCAIIGRIAKFLLKSSLSPHSGIVHDELREELVGWIHSLPPRLRLPIDTARTTAFDRDVHQLHLFYLTTIIILHLKRSEGQLPQALPPAIIAASCTARILRDILARGNSRFLMAITCWHVGTAFIALLQACRIPHLTPSANEDLEILSIAAGELRKMWASANVIVQGFQRLRKAQSDNTGINSGHVDRSLSETNSNATESASQIQLGPSSFQSSGAMVIDPQLDSSDSDFDWMRFFPFVSKSTGGIAEQLVSGLELGTATRGFPSPNNEAFHGTLLAQFQDLFDPFTDYSMGLSADVGFEAAGIIG